MFRLAYHAFIVSCDVFCVQSETVSIAKQHPKQVTVQTVNNKKMFTSSVNEISSNGVLDSSPFAVQPAYKNDIE